MFEYQDRRRPREWIVMLALGVVLLLVSFAPQVVASYWGVRAGLFLPGLIFLAISGALRFRANHLLDRYLESDGIVLSVEPHGPSSLKILNTDELEPHYTLHGRGTWDRAGRGERSESYAGSVVIRFRTADGANRSTRVSGRFSYCVGDPVVMLYHPDEPDEALPEKIIRVKLYSESFEYFMSFIIWMAGGLFFLWLSNYRFHR